MPALAEVVEPQVATLDAEASAVSLVGFKAQNHGQQVRKHGANPLVDDRATTPEVFDPLNERFRFTIDVAASVENTKCKRFYDLESNGLSQSWAGERVWCNPPYSDIEPWVEKARVEVAADDCPLAILLVPANRTEQGWWQRQVEPIRDRPMGVLSVEFLPGRLRFLAPGALAIKPNERPPFGCCLLIFESR